MRDACRAAQALSATISPAAQGRNPDGTPFSPDLNNWVGYLTDADVARENKLVALGPAPPGFAGELEGLILLVALVKLGKTPDGRAIIKDLALRYLKEISAVLQSVHLSSASNPYNCLINDYVCCRVFQRLGIMSAHDAVQSAAWIDHVMGEMLKKEYFSTTLTGLTSFFGGVPQQIAGKVLGAGE